MLSTAAARGALRLDISRGSEKFLATMVAAKIERLAIALSVQSGCLVHGHAADGVFGWCLSCIHNIALFRVRVSGSWFSRHNHIFIFGSIAPELDEPLFALGWLFGCEDWVDEPPVWQEVMLRTTATAKARLLMERIMVFMVLYFGFSLV